MTREEFVEWFENEWRGRLPRYGEAANLAADCVERVIIARDGWWDNCVAAVYPDPSEEPIPWSAAAGKDNKP